MRNLKFTTDYDMFKLLPFNRNVINSHVKTMMESINKMGMLRPVLVCRLKEMNGSCSLYVLDAQHALEACKRLCIEIPYVEISIKDSLDVIYKLTLLNSTSKAWNIHDYINAYAMFVPHYRELSKMISAYSIETMMTISIASNRPSSHASVLGRELRKGEFEVINPKAEEMCQRFEQLFVIAGGSDRWVKKGLLDTFLNKFEFYDHKKTMQNLIKYIKPIQAMDTKQGLAFIEEKVFKAA